MLLIALFSIIDSIFGWNQIFFGDNEIVDSSLELRSSLPAMYVWCLFDNELWRSNAFKSLNNDRSLNQSDNFA